MSKNVAIFIDVANIYYAARGQDIDVDYVALLKHATKGRDLIRAYAYSGLDPENENQRKFLDFLSKNGYKVVHKDIRKFGDGRVKANLDIELVVDLFRLANRMDIAVIISGDGDFASAIRALQDVGVRCEVISFRPNTSSDLIAVADEFTDIMKITGIGRKKEDKGMSMPEMPAKEVNPEFGFREASRGVAAAALAALREGEQVGGRTRRGRTTRGRAAAPEVPPSAAADAAVPPDGEEPVEPMTALEAHVDGATPDGDAARRRRRRRGGRGRGRGRRGEGAEVAGVGEPGSEIGWREFDDLSQLGELTDLGEPGAERAYGFSEADDETLRELGLDAPVRSAQPDAPTAEPTRRPATRGRRPRQATERAEPAAASADAATITETASAAAEPAARPTSRRRRPAAGTAETPAATTAEASESATAPTRARRGRRAAAADEQGSPASEGDAAQGAAGAAPARPRRTRRSPSAASGNGEATEPAAGGEEGIWQRFRSGRSATRRSQG